jgi:hypothetical protein
MKLMKVKKKYSAVLRNSSTLAFHFWIQLEIIKNETHESKKYFRRSFWPINTLALHLGFSWKS